MRGGEAAKRTAKRRPEPHAQAADVEPFAPPTAFEFEVECRLDRTWAEGTSHRVTIHEDWSVSTPHDMEAERVAAAFGGYTSCLTLVDETVPAFRDALPVLLRREHVPVRHDRRNNWRLPIPMQVSNCCGNRPFADIGQAIRHLRGPAHIARAHGVPDWQLRALMSGAAQVWGDWEPLPPVPQNIERLVREPGGLEELWQAGIRPEDLPALAIPAASVDEALPTQYFLGIRYNLTLASWLSDVLEHRPDGDTAAWLAWMDPRFLNVPPEQWGAWLGFGLPRLDVQAAVNAGLSLDTVAEVADAVGWLQWTAARQMVAWIRVRCRPTKAHFVELVRRGLDYSVPSQAAIDALVGAVTADGERTFIDYGNAQIPDLEVRTELAVQLQLLGSTEEVRRARRSGIRTVADLHLYTDPF